MSRVSALCEADSEMMMDFSSRCVERLSSHAPLKLFLSPFKGLLDANVRKEIAKDRMVMEYASSVFEKGNNRTAVDLEGLFESTKKIDSEFVKKFSNPFLSIRIRHDDFADIRKQRISAFIEMVFELLGNWQEGTPFPHIVRQTYTKEGYRTVLSEILHLYNVETKLLGNSITGRGPTAIMTGVFADKLFSTMEILAGEIAEDYSRRTFPNAGGLFPVPGYSPSFGPP
ncbi:MAG: hypothetical protein C0402_14090 [Thermodesulfovibrio sp.]|nr:hypothetical protein [Thermodesulfovibrio sp.]